MFATMTIRACAESIAAEHGWPMHKDVAVRQGEILIDAILKTVSVHPDADTYTLAMNAGSQLPSNDKPLRTAMERENVIGISREEAEALQAFFRYVYIAQDARGVLVRQVVDRLDRYCSDASKAQREVTT
jgi:hypothetical protein